jgi:hypothetical protein
MSSGQSSRNHVITVKDHYLSSSEYRFSSSDLTCLYHAASYYIPRLITLNIDIMDHIKSTNTYIHDIMLCVHV